MMASLHPATLIPLHRGRCGDLGVSNPPHVSLSTVCASLHRTTTARVSVTVAMSACYAPYPVTFFEELYLINGEHSLRAGTNLAPFRCVLWSF